MPPSIASSNWDFTPVINLIRSPVYGGSDPSRHAENKLLSTSPEEELKDTTSCSCQKKHTSRNNGSSAIPRLGDFGSLWNILSRGTGAASAEVDPVEHLEDVDATPHSHTLQSPVPVKILKRPSPKLPNPELLTKEPLRTPPKSIPKSESPKSRKNRAKADVESDPTTELNNQSKAVNEGPLSDSTAEAESDSSIFDPPLSKQGVPKTVHDKPSTKLESYEPYESPPSSFDECESSLKPETIKTSPNGVIRVQSTYKSANERKLGLLTKLVHNFPDYAGHLSGWTVGLPSRPVHVFIDISNVMVGFHDSVKVSRNIPVATRIRRLPLSFQSFSQILERGRPTAKRVLVGSDRFAAIEEGEKLGYETNILDRVQKVKQMARRQVKSRKAPKGASQEPVSSSETNEAAAERWVEQGVDEILHLKILESLLDTDEPATIVLATGDAAEAEYSGGFMKMVERALQRGWAVELVSFSQVTSRAYRRKEFRMRWGDRFRMIALDEYIEELLAT